MPQKATFVPKYRHAKAFGVNVRISQKKASIVCRAIRYKPLRRAKRLLVDLDEGRRTLGGKYYTKAVAEILNLVNSCEKNAAFAGLDMDKLFVHACAHKGTNIQRRRRKGAFGNTLKNANVEVMLIEMGKEPKRQVAKKKIENQLHPEKKRAQEEKAEVKKEIEHLKKETKELEEKVEHSHQEKKEGNKHAEESQ
jgi:ribosomal protein L22